ncbi:MAG TPA: 16S rRNA (cytosine(967)-C(5))-methyltransferase [Legionellales bacterium]|nr:16S rRNA (cytosine(967)-C(5))-methyltransferase [Legionellales bacterium]
MNLNYRKFALQALIELLDDKPLPSDFSQYPPAAKNLALQTCRHYHQLEQIALFLTPKKPQDLYVWAVLILGLCEMHILDKPEHAVIHEMVNLIKKSKFHSAFRFANAILRKSIREKALWQESLAKNEVYLYSHPQWLIDIIKKAWPHEGGSILQQNNIHPPMTLRVNQSKITRQAYLKQLTAAKACEFSPQGIILNEAESVSDLPGFLEGWVSVQDEAAQLAAGILDIETHHRVLDACAAPGGKTSHILETYQPQECVAIELQEKRFITLKNTFERLNLNPNCIQADASHPESWWDGQLFDRILIDAPCSGTGVIRRHPDIKLRRQADNIYLNLTMQKELLQKLWPLLKPKGLLLYATCSILPEENELQIQAFLNTHSDAKSIDINLSLEKKLTHGLQIFPGTSQMDGFYYCLITKK